MITLFSIETAYAASGPLGIDSRLSYDNSGIWKRSNQTALLDVLLLAEVAGGIWEGDEDRFGKTCWQSIDASIISGITTEAGKRIFHRPRPNSSANPNPNDFFKGDCNYSFPSGEVSAVTAIVTPFILEYREDTLWAYGLEILPLYDAMGRMKVQAHWQTDCLASFIIGTAAGYYAHSRNKSFTLETLPGGFSAGLKHKF